MPTGDQVPRQGRLRPCPQASGLPAPKQARVERGKPGDGTDTDADTDAIEVRRIQPYQALKRYVCPGCNQTIERGTGHLVVIPEDAPDLRRHWHHACWAARHRRRPGRG